MDKLREDYRQVCATLYGFYEAQKSALEADDADAYMYYQIRAAVLEKQKAVLAEKILEMERVA